MTALANELSAHDRAVLPTRTRRHFFYKAAAPAVSPDDMAEVARAVEALVEENGLGVAQIEVFSPRRFQELSSASAGAALQRLISGLGLDASADRVSLLTCEWASPHDDSSFSGSAFASLVLRTGDYPYVMSMFHSRKMAGRRGLDLVTSTRVLREGDFVVFDPTIPHMVAPGRPSANALLVLLQAELDIEDNGGPAALLKRFPRHPQDRDEASVFDPVLGSLTD